METEPVLLIANPPAVAKNCRRPSGTTKHVLVSDYWALTKPEVNVLIVIATLIGFYLGSRGPLDHPALRRLVDALLGTLLVASGAGALNQYIERDFDAQMRRTRRRPLTVGLVEPSHALWFGISLSVAGTAYLAVSVNLLVTVLADLALLGYIFLYTPLKRKTPLCMLVGALPGAMPPLIGYAAARGRLSMEAWVLYLILFLWQFPHFMAIAWMYGEDYDRAGYLVLPHTRTTRCRLVALQTIWPLLALIFVSLEPTVRCKAGTLSVAAALTLSLAFFYYGTQFVRFKSGKAARQLLFASILYLPAILAVDANALSLSATEKSNSIVVLPHGEAEFVPLDSIRNSLSIEASRDAVVLLLGGQPVNEPIVAHGSFAVTNNAEMDRVIADFNSGIVAKSPPDQSTNQPTKEPYDEYTS